jgi:SOS-response transcriptional repressor LexA
MTDPRPLTWRQAKVLRFLRTYTAAHGFPPSMRDIGNECGLVSTSSVGYVLDCLIAKGHISRVPGKPRAIVVNDGPASSVPPGTSREDRAREAMDRVQELMSEADFERDQAKAHFIAATAANDQADAAMAMARRIGEEWFLSDLRSLFDIDEDGAA